MKVLSEINAFQKPNSSLSLTVGSFEGVHSGHKAVLQRLNQSAKNTVVVTFLNHPSEILQNLFLPRLCTLEHKLALLEKEGVDTVLLIPFTKELSLLSSEAFLTSLRSSIPFTHLILGYDAHFGHNREGSPKILSKLSHKMGFSLDYVSPVLWKNEPISSSRIRNALRQGDLAEVQFLLGRPYSIQGVISKGAGIGSKMVVPTLNLKLSNIILPPFGVYAVDANINHKKIQAIANLGVAPTLHQHREPLLEVHLLNESPINFEQELEINFHHFIRPEQQFTSSQALKEQIMKDITFVKNYFQSL